ncbi:hypothetical protein [Candidatus Borrelia fainii]
MQSVITDFNIGSAQGYKTFDGVEFNNLLHDLGVDRLKRDYKNTFKYL